MCPVHQIQELVQDHINRTDDGNISIYGFGNIGRVNIYVNDSGIWTEFFHIIGHPVIKAGADSDEQITLADGHVRVPRAMHAQHAE